MDPKATEIHMLKYSDQQLLQKDLSHHQEGQKTKKKCKFRLKSDQGKGSLIFTWKQGIPHPVSDYESLPVNKIHCSGNMN